MLITINGESREVREGITLAGLLGELEIQTRGTAVEINREIVPRASHEKRAIANGDVIEIIRMVGGG
ncbi:MAG: sulfur carrier protein ThiS [Thermodesulfobacteriota bacterium]